MYLLRELSRKHKDIWVKVTDGDGQFLLIEAAGALPSWLEPEVADNRVRGILFVRPLYGANDVCRYGYTVVNLLSSSRRTKRAK